MIFALADTVRVQFSFHTFLLYYFYFESIDEMGHGTGRSTKKAKLKRMKSDAATKME